MQAKQDFLQRSVRVKSEQFYSQFSEEKSEESLKPQISSCNHNTSFVPGVHI